MNKVNVLEKFESFADHWSPKVVGRVQDCEVKLAKFIGEFEWHHHPNEDELFYVVKGRVLIKLRTGDHWLDEGEFFVVPRGVEHLPVAHEEAWVMMIEPAGTLNTGNVLSERTVANPEAI